jgi:hypothetical protein
MKKREVLGKENVLQFEKQDNVIETYIDERGIKVTVYKPQHPRLEELTFPRKKECVEMFRSDE